MGRRFFYISCFLLLSLVALATTSQAAVFGVDDRELIHPTSTKSNLAQATAVGVLSTLITPSQISPNKLQLDTTPLDNGFLCTDQKFSDQPSLSYACSGFLIAPDLLVTAGHCSVNTGNTAHESQMYCEVYGWLFDYQVDDLGHVNTQNIPKENYYTCKEIIYAVNESSSTTSQDWALIRLDRPVVGRTPLTLSAQPPAIGDSLFMIGHPMGIPQTLSQNARVLEPNPVADSFITNLDAFDGNSGSAVFNSDNEVVGILIGGTPQSFLNSTKEANSCSIYNSCDDNGNHCTSLEGIINNLVPIGSEVQNIKPVFDLFKTLAIEI